MKDGIRIYNEDFLTTQLNEGVVTHVITDPEYDWEFTYWSPACFKACMDGTLIAFCKPENQWPKPDERIFWVKPTSTKNFSCKLGRFVEIACVYWGKPPHTFHQLHWSQMTGVYHDLVVDNALHPWTKPLSLIERLVRIYTNPGDTILDPFMGSGVVGVACKNLGRNFIGFEIDKTYFELAKKNLE